MSFLVSGGLGFGLSLIASVVLYSGVPNQQWLAHRKLSFYQALAVFLLLSVLSFWVLHESVSGLSALFIVFTIHMLALSLLPLLTRFKKPLTNSIKRKSWLSRDGEYLSHQPQWVLKTAGTFLLGYPLALFMAALLGFSVFDDAPLDVRSQLIMWLITPIWLTPLSLVFLSKTPLRLLTIMVLFTVVGYAMLRFGWVGG